MAFQIKNFVSIVAGAINHLRGVQSQVTDFNIGSVARTIIEAPSVEIDALYQQMVNGLREAIPVATYNSFNFTRLPAVAASGVVRVTITSAATDTRIPAGTAFLAAGGQLYASVADVVITAGNTFGDVLVAAATAGIIGNLPASTAFTLTGVPAGFVSASNASAFLNGAELETDDQRKQRFALYISTLQRGTVAALIYGGRTAHLVDVNGVETERVKSVSIVEPWLTDSTQPVALVNAYVHNGVGSTSGSLVTQAQTVIDGYTDAAGIKVPGWKAAGVKVVVAAATEVAVNMTAVLTAAPGYDLTALKAAATAALTSYSRELDIGQKWLFAEAVYLVMAIPGVADFVFSTPTANVTATASQKIMPGTITI